MKIVDSKSDLNPTVVYATDRSKTVVLVLILFFVWLCLFVCFLDFFSLIAVSR